MGTHRVAAVLTLIALAVLGGCPAEQPPPPSGYLPPTLVSVSTTSPVLAGNQFRIDVVVQDDEGINNATPPALFGRDGNRMYSNRCDNWFITHQGTGATLNVTCNAPTYMTNGTWTVKFNVEDVGGYSPLPVTTTIDVSGGSNDTSPPTVDSANVTPMAIHPGESVFVVVRASDPSGPVDFGYSAPTFTTSAGYADNNYVTCTTYGYGWVTELMDQITYRCTSSLLNVPGVYRAVMYATDQLGYQSAQILPSFEIVQ